MGLAWWRSEMASSSGLCSSGNILSEDGEPPSSWDAGRLGLAAWRVALNFRKGAGTSSSYEQTSYCLRHFLTHTPTPINAEKISAIEPVDGSGVTTCGGAAEGADVYRRRVRNHAMPIADAESL